MIYLICSVILILTVLAFFLTAGRAPLVAQGKTQWVLRVIAATPLLVSGIAHFARTALFAGIIPPAYPHRSLLVLLSGALELAGAAGLFLSATRRIASTCLAFLMIAIFPANIYIAHRAVGGLQMPGVPVRTAMQMAYIVLLLVAGWGMPRTGRNNSYEA